MAKMCFSLVFAVLVALHMVSNPVASQDSGEELVITSNLKMTVEMPGSCEGQSYCFEKGADYPDEKIKKLLESWPDVKFENPPAQTDIDYRFGNDEPDCLSNSTNEPIYYIIDQKNDKVRVVVQSTKKFQQFYSVKWCRDEGRITRDTPHFLKSSKTLQKFKIECVNTRMDFDFWVLSDEVDPISQKPKMEIASAKGGIPVCCRCRYSVND